MFPKYHLEDTVKDMQYFSEFFIVWGTARNALQLPLFYRDLSWSQGRAMATCVPACSAVSDSLGPVDCSCQAPLCMGFSRQEYWCGVLFAPSGIFQTEVSNPGLLHWQADSLPLHHLGRPKSYVKDPKKKSSNRSQLEPSGEQRDTLLRGLSTTKWPGSRRNFIW